MLTSCGSRHRHRRSREHSNGLCSSLLLIVYLNDSMSDVDCMERRQHIVDEITSAQNINIVVIISIMLLLLLYHQTAKRNFFFVKNKNFMRYDQDNMKVLVRNVSGRRRLVVVFPIGIGSHFATISIELYVPSLATSTLYGSTQSLNFISFYLPVPIHVHRRRKFSFLGEAYRMCLFEQDTRESRWTFPRPFNFVGIGYSEKITTDRERKIASILIHIQWTDERKCELCVSISEQHLYNLMYRTHLPYGSRKTMPTTTQKNQTKNEHWPHSKLKKKFKVYRRIRILHVSAFFRVNHFASHRIQWAQPFRFRCVNIASSRLHATDPDRRKNIFVEYSELCTWLFRLRRAVFRVNRNHEENDDIFTDLETPKWINSLSSNAVNVLRKNL